MGRTSGAARHGRRAIILALVIAASTVRADVTTERSSSILVFPKVISNAPAMDTIIQISNTSNSMVFARCLYVNGAPRDPHLLPSSDNPPLCQEVDFDIFLTAKQPTHWVVSTGRRINSTAPDDRPCDQTGFRDCNGAGLDPGFIPPLWDGFTGELKCIELDSFEGAPYNGNALKGEATIVSADGDASKYNAIGVMGLNTNSNVNNGDDTLCLGSGNPSCYVCSGGTNHGNRCSSNADCPPDGSCISTAEYNACPDTVIVNHFTAGASDPVIDEFTGGRSSVSTEVTVVPCTEDFENQIPGQAVLQFDIYNEFEEHYSTSTPITCWANLDLGALHPVFTEAFLGSRFAQTRIHPAAPDQAGILGVMEEFHSFSAGNESRDALNLHGEGERPAGDVIVLPGAF
jgi:hypothetical protein